MSFKLVTSISHFQITAASTGTHDPRYEVVNVDTVVTEHVTRDEVEAAKEAYNKTYTGLTGFPSAVARFTMVEIADKAPSSVRSLHRIGTLLIDVTKVVTAHVFEYGNVYGVQIHIDQGPSGGFCAKLESPEEAKLQLDLLEQARVRALRA